MTLGHEAGTPDFGWQKAEAEAAREKFPPPKIWTLNPAISPILGQPTLQLPYSVGGATR